MLIDLLLEIELISADISFLEQYAIKNAFCNDTINPIEFGRFIRYLNS